MYFGSLLYSVIKTVHISFYCYPATSGHSPCDNWGIYRVVGWAFLSLFIKVRVLCFQPLYHNCSQLAFLLKSVDAKILLHLWKQIIIARREIRVACGMFQGSLVTKLHNMQTYFLTYSPAYAYTHTHVCVCVCVTVQIRAINCTLWTYTQVRNIKLQYVWCKL
jgi:hypothetical protein